MGLPGLWTPASHQLRGAGTKPGVGRAHPTAANSQTPSHSRPHSMAGDPQTPSNMGLQSPCKTLHPTHGVETPREEGQGVGPEARDAHGRYRACQHACQPMLLWWHKAPSSGQPACRLR